MVKLLAECDPWRAIGLLLAVRSPFCFDLAEPGGKMAMPGIRSGCGIEQRFTIGGG